MITKSATLKFSLFIMILLSSCRGMNAQSSDTLITRLQKESIKNDSRLLRAISDYYRAMSFIQLLNPQELNWKVPANKELKLVQKAQEHSANRNI